jgi:hypothetical protein
MGSIIQAVIQHSLSPREIVLVPDILNHSDIINPKEDELKWSTPDIDATFLEKYWNLDSQYFINNPWSEESLALLQNDKFRLHFYNPNLVSFDMYLKAGVYKNNSLAESDFNFCAKFIALKLAAKDVIIFEDHLFGDAFDSNDLSSVDEIRKKFISQNISFYELILT